MASHAWKNKEIGKIFIKFSPPIKTNLQIYIEYGLTLRTSSHERDFFEKTFLTKIFWLRIQKFAHWQQVHSSVINKKHNFHLESYLTNMLKINIFIK